MSKIDIIKPDSGPVFYTASPFVKLCGEVAQIGFFVDNLRKISEGALTSPLRAIAAEQLQKALKEYDEATK